MIRGVSFEIISDAEELTILNEISSPSKIWNLCGAGKAPKLRCIPENSLGMML
jgi:hypothetical protein